MGRKESLWLVTWLLFCSSLCAADPAAADPKQADPVKEGFRDDFIGKYDKAWQIINENAENISLTKQPGMLTITTERGSIWRNINSPKNLFLIDNPLKVKTDFVMTTRIFGVDPHANYQQAGLICFDDLDNYLKFVLEFDSGNGGKTLSVFPEVEAVDGENLIVKVNDKLDELWLRVVKFDDLYVLSASRDNKEYKVIARQQWGTGHPTQVGLIAKNGGSRAVGLDVHFDEFEIIPLDARPELENLVNEEPFDGSEF